MNSAKPPQPPPFSAFQAKSAVSVVSQQQQPRQFVSKYSLVRNNNNNSTTRPVTSSSLSGCSPGLSQRAKSAIWSHLPQSLPTAPPPPPPPSNTATPESSSSASSVCSSSVTADLNRKARDELAKRKLEAKQRQQQSEQKQKVADEVSSSGAAATPSVSVVGEAIPITCFSNATSSSSSESSEEDEKKSSKATTAGRKTDTNTTTNEAGTNKSAAVLIEDETDEDEEATYSASDKKSVFVKIKELKEQKKRHEEQQATKKRPIIKSGQVEESTTMLIGGSSGKLVSSFIGPKLPGYTKVSVSTSSNIVLGDSIKPAKEELLAESEVRVEMKPISVMQAGIGKDETAKAKALQDEHVVSVEPIVAYDKQHEATSATASTTATSVKEGGLIDRNKLNYSKDELAKYDHLFRMSQMYAAVKSSVSSNSKNVTATPNSNTAVMLNPASAQYTADAVSYDYESGGGVVVVNGTGAGGTVAMKSATVIQSVEKTVVQPASQVTPQPQPQRIMNAAAAAIALATAASSSNKDNSNVAANIPTVSSMPPMHPIAIEDMVHHQHLNCKHFIFSKLFPEFKVKMKRF